MILDNFYDNPDAVVNMVSGDYPIFGCGTGNRSVGLEQINPELYWNLFNAICKIHGIEDNSDLHMFSFFMEHEYNPIEIFNHGWVHIDGKNPDACRMTTDEYKLVLCGQIFLTKNPDPETGVSLCNLNDNINWSTQELYDRTINDYTVPREDYMAGKINLEEYIKLHRQYHNNFKQIDFLDNVYNRMISWKAGTLHGAKMTEKMPKRLNQYFFIQKK